MDCQYGPGPDWWKNASSHLRPRRVGSGFSRGSIVHNEWHGDALLVLLVEDDPVNQKTMATLLKKTGFQANVVGNGLEAIRVLESRSYDVIFMEVQMPHIWI